MKYFALLEDGTLTNPQMLECTNPSNLLAHEAPSIGNGSLCCLP